MESGRRTLYIGGVNISPRVRLLAVALGSCVLAFPGSTAFAGVDGVDPSSEHLWTLIKDDTYSQKDTFSRGADALSSNLNGKMGELRTKRAAMTADTDEWDFSMKEVDASRAQLTSAMAMLAKAATPDTWNDAKVKVGDAWHRAQLALDAMNSTRTT
jgi:hypothetical protein